MKFIKYIFEKKKSYLAWFLFALVLFWLFYKELFPLDPTASIVDNVLICVLIGVSATNTIASWVFMIYDYRKTIEKGNNEN